MTENTNLNELIIDAIRDRKGRAITVVDMQHVSGASTGAHDMYKQGEYMIWTDGAVYCCKSDTIFSPGDYAQAWMRITQ